MKERALERVILDAGGEIGRKPASGCLRISAPIGAIMAEKASERGRNAKHPAKVLTFESMDRRRRIPAPSPAIRPRSEAFPAFSSSVFRLPSSVFRLPVFPSSRLALREHLDDDAAV